MNNRKWVKLTVILVIAAAITLAATQRFDTIVAKKVVITGSGGLEMGQNAGVFDLNGKELELDVDGDTSITADTDDQIDIEIGGTDEFVFTAGVFDIGEGTLGRIDLDADNDTSIKASADDILDMEIGGQNLYRFQAGIIDIAVSQLTRIDFDVDNDTSIRSSEDDMIDFEAGGSDVMTVTTTAARVDVDLNVGTEFIVGPRTALTFTVGARITPTGTYQPLTTGPEAKSATSDIAEATLAGTQLILENMNATNVITIDGTGGTVECKANVVLGPRDTLTLIWNGTDWICISSYDNS